MGKKDTSLTIKFVALHITCFKFIKRIIYEGFRRRASANIKHFSVLSIFPLLEHFQKGLNSASKEKLLHKMTVVIFGIRLGTFVLF